MSSAPFEVVAHNLFFRLEPEEMLADLSKTKDADVWCLSEGEGERARTALRRLTTQNPSLRLFHPGETGNPIMWNSQRFRLIPDEEGIFEVHKGHPTARFNPARDFTFVGLRDVDHDRRLLVVAVHSIAGYAKPENLTPWGDSLDRWKNWAASQYYLDLLSFVARQMSREFYDGIIVAGDYNSRLANDSEWYFPGAMLAGVLAFDSRLNSIDHICHTLGSSLRHTNEHDIRKGVHSDHPILRDEFTWDGKPGPVNPTP